MSNRLAAETSPYLRQHADNPVDWWPWSDEALASARAQEKPILLSIGYSACHWCHVMAHESFEDDATARVMNALFVNIKVDREERPDLDKIYQLSHQALTQRGGGWPLTVFLSPDDLVPFYAGTYFPKDARYGMPPFGYVLEQVRGYWDSRRDDVRAQTAALATFLRDYDRGDAAAAVLDDTPIHSALAQVTRAFDPEYGGHRGAPKFPHCPEMELLLDLSATPSRSFHPPTSDAAGLEPLSRRERGRGEGRYGPERTDDPDPHPSLRATFSQREKGKDMVGLTLTRMADGGIHDQIGGGFCRYSVDERWEIPHFEKMLYDNAQLLPLYALASRQFGEARFARIARDLLAWIVREMTAKEGGFFTALDADSEHEEGKFYVWQRDDVRALLDDGEFAVAERYYGFDRPPNFEQHAWNPVMALPLDRVAAALQVGADDAAARLARATQKLFAARSMRVRPGLDDKILTANNALMIGGIARAARLLDAGPLMGLADDALDRLRRDTWRDGRLYAKAGDDAARFPAYLDDHAFLLDALLECLQCRWNSRDLSWAIALADALLERFEDREHGGFFFTAHDHEALPQRPKPWIDEAVQSGNGTAARTLLRLGHLLGETRYLDAAERTLRAAWSTMQQMPHACTSLVRALNDFLQPRTHVVIRFGEEQEATAWRAALGDVPALASTDRVDSYFVPDTAADLPAMISARKAVRGGVAYVCRGTNCLAPIFTRESLALALNIMPSSG
ncbi:MAG TPA: thioredoxin domain-containing protein [Rudaea sp.]|jgi:hypothetical protein